MGRFSKSDKFLYFNNAISWKVESAGESIDRVLSFARG